MIKKLFVFSACAVIFSGCGMIDSWAIFGIGVFIKIYLDLVLMVGAFITLCIMSYGMANKVSVDRTGREATILKIQTGLILFFFAVFCVSFITYYEIPQYLLKTAMNGNEALKELWEARK